MAIKTNWYKDAVVYQIYPLSYMDSNNDGIGDIPGIISKLDYIRDLGATAIWFSPLYPSPWKDYGYDIADYKAIHPAFGTMEDFEELLAECHKRGMKVMMDAVFNHTSDQHEWFKAALADKDSPYRDYYIIREGRRNRKGELIPPTNWTSSFTGSAWERIEGTDEYYLHLFAPEQPDLNWENPKVREEMADVLRFWLDKGVDGFRFDVFNMISKIYPLKDDKNPLHFQKGTPFYVDGPRMHEFLKELNDNALSLYDTYTVGESYVPDEEHAHRYINEESGELDTIFDFEHLASDNMLGLKMIPKPFDLKQFKRGLIDPQLRYHGTGWNTLVLENHDQARSVSRFGIDTKKYRYEAATFLAMIAFLGWGTPFIYQGEEIGMTNMEFSSRDEMKDPVSHFIFDMVKGFHVPDSVSFKMMRSAVRDNARTPMQWDDSVNAGFNQGAEPWQCVNPDYKEINVAADLAAGSTAPDTATAAPAATPDTATAAPAAAPTAAPGTATETPAATPDTATVAPGTATETPAATPTTAVTDPADPAFDPGRSIYRFYQKLLAIRKSEPVLRYGSTIEYYPDDRQIIAYSRSYDGKRFLVAGNFSARKVKFELPADFESAELNIRLTNRGRLVAFREMTLEPYESILLEEPKRG